MNCKSKTIPSNVTLERQNDKLMVVRRFNGSEILLGEYRGLFNVRNHEEFLLPEVEKKVARMEIETTKSLNFAILDRTSSGNDGKMGWTCLVFTPKQEFDRFKND